jgi:hypothetical protein
MRTPLMLLLLVCLCGPGVVFGGSPPIAAGSKPPAPIASPFSVPAQQQPESPLTGPLFGLAGQTLDPPLLQAEYQAGIRLRLVEIAWNDLQPGGTGDWATVKAQQIQQSIDTLAATGPDVQFTLDLGIQYPPAWAAALDPLVDQYGNTWMANNANGGANVYWSPTVRAALRTYIQQIFTHLDFHGRLWAVRIGPAGGELLYPQLLHAGQADSFWAFDATAQAQSPVPGWRPGQPSPNGEAQRFYYWYVDNLADYFNFMLGEIRHYYAGYVAPVTPGTGMCADAVARLIAGSLYDPSASDYGTGNYWYRLFPLLGPDANILHWASSVGDISGLNENSPNWWEWSSAKALAWLAHQNGRPILAENPGHNAYDSSGGADPRTTMQWIFGAVRDNGYLGLLWIRESDMTEPGYASLPQYAGAIAEASGCHSGFTDIPTSSPFYTVITDLVARQAISGYGDCTFRPGNTITRGQVAKVLVLGLGLPLTNPARADFSDVPSTSAFYPYVETAYNRGIIAGYADGTFRPNNPVTRAQLAKMVSVARGWPLVAPGSPTFADVPPGNAFYAYIETAYRHNLISGYTCGTACLQFRPNGTATRGQGSKIIDLGITGP